MLLAAAILLAFPCASRAADVASVAQSWRAQGLQGTALIQDVRTGAVRARLGEVWGGRPLSVAKLFLAAIYYRHQPQLRGLNVDIDRLIALGSDDGGRRLALDLRRALGSETMLGDLARFGFARCGPRRATDCTELAATTADADWAEALSLGERGFRVTPEGLAAFMRTIGRGGLDGGGRRAMTQAAARRLQRAMIATVERGTARSNRDRLAGIGFMGGKTGTTRSDTPAQFDGLFSGLIFDRAQTPLHAVIVYVRHGGQGGLLPARIAADLGRALLERDGRAARRARN